MQDWKTADGNMPLQILPAAMCRFKFRLWKWRQFAQDSETAGLHKVIFNKKAVTALSCDRFLNRQQLVQDWKTADGNMPLQILSLEMASTCSEASTWLFIGICYNNLRHKIRFRRILPCKSTSCGTPLVREHFNIKTFVGGQKTAYRRVGWHRLDFML